MGCMIVWGGKDAGQVSRSFIHPSIDCFGKLEFEVAVAPGLEGRPDKPLPLVEISPLMDKPYQTCLFLSALTSQQPSERYLRSA